VHSTSNPSHTDIVATGRNVQVKIILGRLRAEWNRPIDPKLTALKDLSKYVEIKTKVDWHGRMIIVDDRLIVGSLDLDRQGLTVHDNVVFETDDQTTIQKAKELFFDITLQSATLQIPST
jgi:hypothetical protein